MSDTSNVVDAMSESYRIGYEAGWNAAVDALRGRLSDIWWAGTETIGAEIERFRVGGEVTERRRR